MANRFKQLLPQPYFILLLPVVYLLQCVVDFYPFLKLNNLFVKSSCIYLVIAGLFFIWFYKFPASRKYALLVFFMQVEYFYFGTILEALNYLPYLGKYSILLPVSAIVWFCIFIIIRNRNEGGSKIFRYLNILLVIFIVLASFEIFSLTTNTAIYQSSSKTAHKSDSVKPDPLNYPDIYFIIFDGYSASRTLLDQWNYDNRELDSFFRKSGFFYAYHSRSNYNITAFSVASILNMEYLKESVKSKIHIDQFQEASLKTKKSVVVNYLIEKGYQPINKSIFHLPGGTPAIDFDLLNSPDRLIQSKTFLSRFIFDIGWNFNLPAWLTETVTESKHEQIARAQKELTQITSVYSDLKKISASDYQKPVFVYGHILLPHEPYYYDSTGQLLQPKEWFSLNSTDMMKYLSQLKYVNTLIKELVVKLKNDAKRPRVIIIQSDHGHRHFPGNPDKNLEFNNLNAIYFSDGKYEGLSDSMTSVNTFRIVFRKYFNDDIPLLKDSTVYIRH